MSVRLGKKGHAAMVAAVALALSLAAPGARGQALIRDIAGATAANAGGTSFLGETDATAFYPISFDGLAGFSASGDLSTDSEDTGFAGGGGDLATVGATGGSSSGTSASPDRSWMLAGLAPLLLLFGQMGGHGGGGAPSSSSTNSDTTIPSFNLPPVQIPIGTLGSGGITRDPGPSGSGGGPVGGPSGGSGGSVGGNVGALQTPEPGAYALLAGLLAPIPMVLRRRRSRN